MRFSVFLSVCRASKEEPNIHTKDITATGAEEANRPTSHQDQSLGTSIRRADLIAYSGLFILATIIILPVLLKGFPAGFDAVRHYRWTSQFIDALRDGAIYPRWLPSANDGQGSPVILYYPPLPFYVSAAFSLIVGNTLLGMSLSCWLALALSGLTMYGFTRSLLSSGISFAAAALYMLAPYHLVDLYQGSTVSEFWSFVWVPLLLDAVRRVVAGKSLRAIAHVAVGYALLLLTHVPVAFLVSLALGVYAVSLTRKLRALLRITAGLALGAGIAAIFLIPVIFETSYVRLFFKFDYRDYFVFEHLRAALTSTRFSSPSLFTYTLDIDVVAVGLLGLFLASCLLLWTEWRSGQINAPWSKLGLAVWVVTALSFLMSTRLTAPIWVVTPGLTFLFFPYRWLVAASAGTSFLTAMSIRTVMRDRKRRVLKIGVLAIVVALNLAITAAVVWRAPHDPAGLEEGLTLRDTREYRPVWWDGQLQRELWEQAAFVESGAAEVRAIDDTGIRQSYSINVATESVIAFRPLYFPGWIALVDGKQRQISPSADGHIQLIFDPGEHDVTLSFENTWPRAAGVAVSAISLVGLIVMLAAARRTRLNL